jgi:hypothetical protein
MENDKETFAKIVAEMDEESKNREYDYVGIVATQNIDGTNAGIYSSVSDDTTSDIAMLGRLQALGLVLGLSPEERSALSGVRIDEAKKILAYVGKKARKAIQRKYPSVFAKASKRP